MAASCLLLSPKAGGVNVRALQGPSREARLNVVFYSCSECSWFFVVEEPDVNPLGEELQQAVSKAFAEHGCPEYPRP